MGEVYSLAESLTSSGIVSAPCNSSERATRSASIVRCRRLGRFSAFRMPQRDVASKRTSPCPNPDPESPNVTLSVSTTRSLYGESEVMSQRIPPPRGWVALQIHDSGADTPLRIPSGRGAGYSLPELEAASDSVESRAAPPVGRGRKHVFDRSLKGEVWGVARNFSESPGLLANIRKSGVSRGRLIVLAIEAVMQHCKTAAITRLAINTVSGIARYFIDTRPTDNLSLTGEHSVVLIHGNLDQAAVRGRAVPGAMGRSISRRADALQIDWPLGRSIISAASTAESNSPSKQVPPMAIETVELIEGIATNREIAPIKRAFAAGI